MQSEFVDLRYNSQNHEQKVMTCLRQHLNATARNLGELHTNQVTLDTDGQVLKSKMSDVMFTLCDMDSKVDVLKNDSNRQENDFNVKIQKLTQRIDKAEEDRMDKYYK